MKICIYGAGAIGGSIAARLLKAGVETSVVARGEHLAAIRAGGLFCEAPDGRFGGKLPASDNPSDLGKQDVVIVGVKAHGAPGIVDGLKALLHDQTAVVYALNGIPWWYFHGAGGAQEGKKLDRLDPGGRLWNEIGVDRAVGCVLNYASSVIAPGVVRQLAAVNNIAIGEPKGGDSARLRDIAAALRAAGFTVEAASPIRLEVWAKLRRLLPTSTLTTLTMMTAGGVASSAELRATFLLAMTEINALAAAYGYALPQDFEARIDAQRPLAHRPSMLQDLEAGRSMEVDAQLAATQHMAEAAGVAIPTLDVLIGLVRARARAAGLYNG
jgi:2-dehydropantoate 2-reductase